MEIFDNDQYKYLTELDYESEHECTECNNSVDKEGTQCSGVCFESSMR